MINLLEKLKILLLILTITLSVGLSKTSQEDLISLQDQAIKTTIDAYGKQCEYETRLEYIKRTERENFYLKLGYLILLGLSSEAATK